MAKKKPAVKKAPAKKSPKKKATKKGKSHSKDYERHLLSQVRGVRQKVVYTEDRGYVIKNSL